MGSVGRKYKVIRRRGRGRFVCRWWDETTDQWREKTLDTARRRDAEQLAIDYLATLSENSPLADPLTWAGFRAKYEADKGPTMTSSLVVWRSAANHFERITSPKMLADATGPRINTYEVQLRLRELSEASIATYLRAIRAALNWAVEVELLKAAPRVRIPKHKGKRRSKGRAITGEELDRLLKSLKGIVGDTNYKSWERLVNGLWLSGLRLSEALALWWDRDDKIMPLNVDGRRPLLAIPGRLQKSKRDETCPLSPEFAAFLRDTPEGERTGPIFRPIGERREARSASYAGRVISAAGKAAKIFVARDGEKVRYASAHDLRRTFASRWSRKVLPPTLMAIMRHRDISTTMDFYVSDTAEQTADVLWQTVTRAGDTKGDTRKTRKS